MRSMVLLVDAKGYVVDASSTARQALGSSVGRRCSDVVDLRQGGALSPCSRGCAAQAVATSSGHVHRGTVRGHPSRVTCTGLGDHVVVMVDGDSTTEVPCPPTPREREVLRCVAAGMTTKETAVALGISFATARTHLEHVRERLGARSRAAAVAIATQNGWLNQA